MIFKSYSPKGLGTSTIMDCVYITHFKPCDWSTRLLSLGSYWLQVSKCKLEKQKSKNHKTYRMSKCGETCLNVGRPPVMVFQFCTVMDSTSEPGEKFMRVISLGLSSVKLVLQYRLGYSRVCIGCGQKCTHLY